MTDSSFSGVVSVHRPIACLKLFRIQIQTHYYKECIMNGFCMDFARLIESDGRLTEAMSGTSRALERYAGWFRQRGLG